MKSDLELKKKYPQIQVNVDGGLISYGPSIIDAYRNAGVYVGQSSNARSQPICRFFNRPNTNL
jgi:hypothetical protein